jgi:hypothetical protein
MINVSFEAARNICGRESAPPNRIRLVFNRPAWVAITILAFVGCLNFAGVGRASAQEAQAVSCEEKCSIEQKQCLDSQQTEDLCGYDYKQCAKACGAK